MTAIEDALKEIEAELQKASWWIGEIEVKESSGPIPKEFKSYFGETKEWNFMVVTWTDDQGSKSDGTATKKGGLILRFSPKLAQLAAELAKKGVLD